MNPNNNNNDDDDDSPHEDTPTEDSPNEDSYASMLAELEAILAELESDTVDVDVLAVRVARAHELVEACRDRIERARLAVEQVVAERAER